jgi:hypothetical protein
MCKRQTNDPLVRLFLDEWRLNPLAVPRERAEPGDIWLKRSRQVVGPLELEPLLEAPVALPDADPTERLGDLNGTSSHAYELKVGLGLLGAFLTALGAGAAVQKVEAGYERNRARTVSVRFSGVTRDAIDAGRLGRALSAARFDERHALAKEGDRRFVAAAVVRAPSLAIRAQDERKSTVTLEADVVAAVNAHASTTARTSEDGEVTYTGTSPLAIGVELYELSRREDGTLSMGLPGAAEFRAGRRLPPAPAFIGDDDEALIG